MAMRNVLTLTEPVRFPFIIRLFRIHSWCYLLGIPLLAVLHAGAPWQDARVASVFALSAVYFCWGYVFNNLFDLDEDSSPRNSFRLLPWGPALSLTLVLHALFLGISVAHGLFFEAAFVSLVNAAYSIPPYRLKRFLVPSLLANGIFFSFPYYASARILKSAVGTADLRFAALVFLLFLPLQHVHFLEHEEAAGKQIGSLRRAGTGLLFGALCVAAFFADPLRWGLPQATVAYSALSMLFLLRLESVARARVAIRFVSMGFGIYLAAAAVGTAL